MLGLPIQPLVVGRLLSPYMALRSKLERLLTFANVLLLWL